MGGLPLGLIFDFNKFVVDGSKIIRTLLIDHVLLVFTLLGCTFLLLFQLQLHSLLALLQFFDLVFKVKNVKTQVFVFILELLNIWRIFPSLLKVFYLFVFKLDLSLKLVKVFFKRLQRLSKPLLKLVDQSLVVHYNLLKGLLIDFFLFNFVLAFDLLLLLFD